MSEKPIRIQRKRTKGWKMPENTVSVCRPGKWGNRFKVEDFRYAKIDSDPAYSLATEKVRRSDEAARRLAVEAFEDWLEDQEEARAEIRRGLRGKNLACFCPLDQPCHADILLEIANRE